MHHTYVYMSCKIVLQGQEEDHFDAYYGFEDVVQRYTKEVGRRANAEVQAKAAEPARILEQEEAAAEKPCKASAPEAF